MAALEDEARLNQVVAVRPGVGARAAAVLILISEGGVGPIKGDDPLEPPNSEGGPELLFVERPLTMRTHAAQIAFPGGAADPEDVDLADTALREAYEETGVDRDGIEVLGLLPAAHVAVSGFDVSGVVAWWRQPSPVLAVDPREVASVLVVPVVRLVDARNRFLVHHPSGYVGPAFQIDDHLIWGLTAHLLDGVLDLAGWQRPWDERRTLEIPERYLTSPSERGGPDAH